MLTKENITKPIQILQYYGDEDILLVPDYVSSVDVDISNVTISIHNNAIVLLTAQTNSDQNGMYKYTGSSLTPYYFDFFHNLKKIYKVTEDSSYIIYNNPIDSFNQFSTIKKNDVIIVINKPSANLPYEWYTYDKILDPKVRFNREIIINNFCALGTNFNDKTNEIILDLNNSPSYPVVLTSEIYNGLNDQVYHVITDIIKAPDIDYKNILSYELEEGVDFTIDAKSRLVIDQNLIASGLAGQGKLSNWRVLFAADPNFLNNNSLLIKSKNNIKLYNYDTSVNNPYNELSQDLVRYPFSIDINSSNIIYEKRNLIQNNFVTISGLPSSTYVNSSFYIQKQGSYEVRTRLYSNSLVLLSEDRVHFNVKQLLNLPTPTPTPTPSSKKHTVVFDAGPRLVIDNCEDCYKDFLSATVTNMSEESRYYYEFGVYAYGNTNPDEPRDTINTDDIIFTTNSGILNNGTTTENIRTLMTTGIGKIRTTLYIKVINLDNYVTSISYLTLEKCDRDFCATTPTPTPSKAIKSYPPRTPTKTKTPTPTQTSTKTPTPTPTPTTPLYPPDIPTNLVALAGNTSVSLSWTAPAASIIRDYIIEYSVNGGASWIVFGDGISTNTLTTVTGLTNGTPYLFRVAASNGAGSGPYVTTASPVLPVASPPFAPTVVSVIGGDNQASLTWTTPNNGGAPITDYIVQYSSNVGVSWTTVTKTVSVNTSLTVTGLTNGASYIFRVAAINSAGTGQYSVNSTSVIPATLPGAPTGLSAILSGQNISLSWTAPSSNGGAAITDYAVQYASSSSSYATWVQINDGVSTATSATVTNLTFGQSYIFRVAAINRVGGGAISSSTSPILFAGVPSAPSSVLPSVSSGSVILSWTIPANNGSAIIDYTIQISGDNGLSWTNISTNNVGNTITISSPTVVLNSSYIFRVAARNSIGLGTYTTSTTVVVYPQGNILTWGDNTNDTLGDATLKPRTLPALPSIVWDKVLFEPVGGKTGIALSTDGKIYSFGEHTRGLTGLGQTSGSISSPTQIGSASNWIKIFIGAYNAYAINNLGELWGWGLSTNGSLGNGVFSGTFSSPVRIGSASNWVNIAVSSNTIGTAAINSLGELYVTGIMAGYVGLGSTLTSFTKVVSPFSTGWSEVTVGDNHIVAINNGRLYSGGNNASTGLNLSVGVTNSLTQIGSSNNWTKVISSTNHTLAINSGGTLWAWGNNTYGQLGDGSTISKLIPVQIGSLSNWSQDFIATSKYASLAINSLGELYVWGYNAGNSFGDGFSVSDFSYVTKKIRDLTNYTHLAMSNNCACFIVNNVIYFAGNTQSVTTSSAFVRIFPDHNISNSNNFTQIAAGRLFGTAFNALGQHFVWGSEPNVYQTTGFKLTNRNNLKSIAAGNRHYLAIDNNDNLLIGGLSSAPASSSLLSLSSVNTSGLKAKKIAAGLDYSFFITTDGILYAIGNNYSGVLGIGSASPSNAYSFFPVVTPLGKIWRDIYASQNSYSAAAITTTGELYTWGYNNLGQLGLGDSTARYSPERVGVQNNWVKVAIGNNFMIAMNSLGELWSWGGNSLGQLGTTIGPYSFTPVRIGSASNWTDIAAGESHAIAKNSSGEVWAWGYNNSGQLGDGTFITRTTPVRVGAQYTWLSISTGGNFSMGIIN